MQKAEIGKAETLTSTANRTKYANEARTAAGHRWTQIKRRGKGRCENKKGWRGRIY